MRAHPLRPTRFPRSACFLPAVLLALLPAGVRSAAAQETRRPNIVIVLTDDQGIHDLSCYGRADQPTPHLDRLAEQGLRFTSAYCAQPICSPSRAALLTGKAPARLHLTTYLPGRPDAPSQKLLHPQMLQHLPLEEVTLAERLRAAGYATACIGKWHLGGASYGPREQGFDVYFPGKANTKPSATEGGKGEYQLTAQALKFMAANRDRPFFLYLAHNTPHIPLGAKAELVEKHRGAFNPVYAAMMETLDDTIGQLIAQLDELGLSNQTLFIFTSDNGGLHVPEGAETPATHNGPFRAGKGYIYEGGLRVPLIVRWPGKIRPGITDVPTVSTDCTQTVLEAAGLDTAPQLDGQSMAWLLFGSPTSSSGQSEERTSVERPEQAPRSFFWHFPHYTNQGGRPAGAMRAGDWKLVEHYEDGRLELYHLGNDPGETTDLAAEEPERAAAMRKQLAAWRTSVGAQENRPNPDYDAELARQIYEEFDTTRLPAADDYRELREQFQEWRERMNAAIR